MSSGGTIAKNTMYLYIRMFFTMLVSLYTSRVVLDALGETDYGIYNVVGGFVAMFAIISGAMTTATQRFLSFEIGKGEQGNVKEVFSTAVMIHIILAGIVLILGETFGLWFLKAKMNFPPERYAAAGWVFQFSLLTFLVNVLSVPYNAAIIAHEKMAAFAYIGIFETLAKLAVALCLAFSPVDTLIFYAALLSMISIAVRLIYGTYCHKKFPNCRFTWTWSKDCRRRMVSFVGWNMVGSAAIIAKEQGINVMLNLFFGAVVNAARGIVVQIQSTLQAFVTNFQYAMNPQIVKLYASDRHREMFSLVFRGSKISFCLMLILSLPFIFEAPAVLDLWLKEVPALSALFLRIILVTSLISCISGPLITSMHASGIVRNYQIVVGGISLMTLPIAYVFLKAGYPPQSALITAAAIEACCLVARIIMLRSTIAFPAGEFVRKVLLRIFLTAIVAPILPLIIYLVFPESWIQELCVGLIAIISAAASSIFICFDSTERGGIIQLVRNFFSKGGTVQ